MSAAAQYIDDEVDVSQDYGSAQYVDDVDDQDLELRENKLVSFVSGILLSLVLALSNLFLNRCIA